MQKTDFSLRNILLEILIVIIGISIAFWLNNWRESTKEGRVKRVYLESFKEELETDRDIYEFQVRSNKVNLQNIDALIDLVEGQQYDHDSIDYFIGVFLKRNNWNLKNNTFEILKGSGKLELISNFELRKSLSSFYELRHHQTTQITSSIGDFLENHFNTYLTENTDYYKPIRKNAFVRDLRFHGLLKRWRSKVNYKLSIYEAIIDEIENDLLPMIKVELTSL